MVSRRIVMICLHELLCTVCCSEFNTAPSALLQRQCTKVPGFQAAEKKNIFYLNKSQEFTQKIEDLIDFSPSLMWFIPNFKEAGGSFLCVHSKTCGAPESIERGRPSLIRRLFLTLPQCAGLIRTGCSLSTRKYPFVKHDCTCNLPWCGKWKCQVNRMVSVVSALMSWN